MKLPAGITNRGLFVVGALAGVAGVIVMLARRTTAAPVINVQPATAPVTDASQADLIGAMEHLAGQISDFTWTQPTPTPEPTPTPTPEPTPTPTPTPTPPAGTGPIYSGALHNATAGPGAMAFIPGSPSLLVPIPAGKVLPVVQVNIDGVMWWFCEQGEFTGYMIRYHNPNWSVSP